MGVPLIAGAFLIIGGLLGFYTNWHLDRQRVKREDAKKWHDEVRRLAGEELTSSRALHEQSRLQSSLDNVEPDFAEEPADMREKAEGLEQDALREVMHHHSDLGFIAPKAIVDASAEVLQAAHTVASAGSPYAEEPRLELRAANNMLIKVVPEYLGIKDQ